MGFWVAIIHRWIETLIALRTDYTTFFVGVQIDVAIFTGAGVTSFCICADSIFVTIIGEAIGTFILVNTLAFSTGLEKAWLAFTNTPHANRVHKRSAVCINVTCAWLLSGGWLCRKNLGDRWTIGDSVSDKVVNTNANSGVVRRYNATRVFMTNKTYTHIPCKTFERTPFHCHIVPYIASIRENGFIARETTTFEFLRRIVVHTERAKFVPVGTWIGQCLTFVDGMCAVSAFESIGALLIMSDTWIIFLGVSTGNHTLFGESADVNEQSEQWQRKELHLA
jgi:hypothetical protein